MARSPATPDKANKEASELPSKVDIPSLNKVNTTFVAQQAAMHEPSPASTYGDTAGSRSVPATPQDYRTSSKFFSLLSQILARRFFGAFPGSVSHEILNCWRAAWLCCSCEISKCSAFLGKICSRS